MIIVSDIDGTLADISKRLIRAGKQPSVKNIKRFQGWLDRLQNNKILIEDSSITGMKEFLVCLSKRCTIVYLTGRSSIFRSVTKRWLTLHGFPKGQLIMRPRGSYTIAKSFKEKKMLQIAKKAGGEKIIVIDDDGDDTCSKMYKKHGWTHLKAMENVW